MSNEIEQTLKIVQRELLFGQDREIATTLLSAIIPAFGPRTMLELLKEACTEVENTTEDESIADLQRRYKLCIDRALEAASQNFLY